MKLLVALALAAAPVSGSQLPPEFKPCDGFKSTIGTCQTFNTNAAVGTGKSFEATEKDCLAEATFDIEVEWCPPIRDPVGVNACDTSDEIYYDCTIYSESCQRSSCATGEKKNFGDRLTEEECNAKVSENLVGFKWCPAATEEKLQARCKNKNQFDRRPESSFTYLKLFRRRCIIRQDKNGKLVRKNKNSNNGACDAALYDCASSE